MQSCFINTQAGGLPVSFSPSYFEYISFYPKQVHTEINKAPVKKSGLRLNKRFKTVDISYPNLPVVTRYNAFGVIEKNSIYYCIYNDPAVVLIKSLRGPPVVA